MDATKYKEIEKELDSLINIGVKVSNNLAGTKVRHRSESYADIIFTKLLSHAISLKKLSPSPKSSRSELWDYPSACSVARCIIEAYDVLEYIALSKISEVEKDFRILVWKLHDYHRRYSMLEAIKSNMPQVESIREDSDELQTEVVLHRCFLRTKKDYQKRIRNGNAPSFLCSHKELNEKNGINHEYYTIVTMMLSQYVHTLPIAIHQLQYFKAGTSDAIHMSAMPIQYSLPFVARAISRMIEVFPGGSTNVGTEDIYQLKFWNLIAEKGFDS